MDPFFPVRFSSLTEFGAQDGRQLPSPAKECATGGHLGAVLLLSKRIIPKGQIGVKGSSKENFRRIKPLYHSGWARGAPLSRGARMTPVVERGS
ncbi:hypothetical protein GCM10010140_10100 [Streptosporangium pseudovulgare]|uniref:Uncharacterized protein n=1 Tax=Streptosporangium pseudovulgare TaxID=35765 RepID=A0ABQ2QKJ4_9ACTN|nr:hypothetical protein GCM10010140_10100 [Streptosporangium pseudovulgare]